MRLIDADKLKEKLLKMQNDIANKKVARGSTKSDAWILAYLLILDEYVKMLDEMPSATQHYDCNHDCDAIYEAYNGGYSKGREDVLIAEECMKKYHDINTKMEEQAKKQMEDYCKNDCDATYEAYNKGYSKGSDDTLNECNSQYTALRRAYLKRRKDAINEYHPLKDYCKKRYNTLNNMRKEQKIENSEMTRKEVWDKVIQDLKTLDAGLIVTMAEKLRTDVIHGTIKQEDKSSMWTLVDDLGYYSIKGQTIKYLPEYQELITLMRMVF